MTTGAGAFSMKQVTYAVDRLKAYLGAEAAAANIEVCFDATPDLPAGPSIPPTVSFQLPAAKRRPAGR
jgi:hypothetical protein